MNIFILIILIILLYICYKLYQEYAAESKQLVIENFTVNTYTPDCLALSNNVVSAYQLPNENINLDNIHIVQKQYQEQLKNNNLSSNFMNDCFIDKGDNNHKFCITKLFKNENTKSCIYIPGNNDYFYNKKLATQLYNKGYNFFAISFPNYGFVSDTNNPYYSTFASIPSLYKYIDFIVKYYKLNQIDMLIGHSTGGLIATCYAEYKNRNNLFIKRLVLSSPLLDWYGDPNPKSYLEKEDFLKNVITPLALVIPDINLKSSVGTPNLTTCEEFNELNFNPKYKSLTEINTYPQWIRACTLQMRRVQGGKINVKCNVDVLVSDKSVYWKYSTDGDNTLDVSEIMMYSKKISTGELSMHVIKNSVHTTFLHVSDITELLKI